ncbi:type 4 fimbrial biogenesis protein FimT [Lysobacter xinjiangensis]|uniref:Type II secretion system protein H n=1 Tax=Cognatilysobacter xinjiangensis TaxID=546892 RepID=A0ABQ3BQK7_9GAMM|nr:GspH/FimT family pseudopilin [Lysobacter xinjiangensis]GGZ54538.1 type 4 fimbrial biogenesis protein FimT [Lysobacter xinjiangensis]
MRRMRGLTLPELVITLAVLSIALGLGVPAARHVMDSVRATTSLHQLTASLAIAHNAAVTYRQPVTLCPSRDGASCLDGTDWSEGWIAYRDPLRQDAPATAADVLRRFDRQHPTLRLTTSTGRPRVRYLPNGSAAGTNASFRLCRRSGALLGIVVVANSGRARRERPSANAACS